jgi:hypothetical protein
MQFVLMIYHGQAPLPGTDRWKSLPVAEQKAIYAEYAEFNKATGLTTGLPLGQARAAKTVRMRDGKADVKDGPYLSEAVGGYAVFEAENLDAALALAARIPAARLGGAVEIRPSERYW